MRHIASRLATIVILAGFGVVVAGPAFAATRTPCSGKKGGVDHCDGGKFICKDGSKSTSKKICEKPQG